MASNNPFGLGGGGANPGLQGARLLQLEFPQSLAVYDDYAAAQKAVDFLSDKEFPVQNCMIVGTDLKQVERITGRLTTGKIAVGGALSGLWLGIFIGIVFALFDSGSGLACLVSCSSASAIAAITRWAGRVTNVQRREAHFNGKGRTVLPIQPRRRLCAKFCVPLDSLSTLPRAGFLRRVSVLISVECQPAPFHSVVQIP